MTAVVAIALVSILISIAAPVFGIVMWAPYARPCGTA